MHGMRSKKKNWNLICLRISHWKGDIHQTICAMHIMSGVMIPLEGDQWASWEAGHTCSGNKQQYFDLFIWMIWQHEIRHVKNLLGLNNFYMICCIITAFKKTKQCYNIKLFCLLTAEGPIFMSSEKYVFIPNLINKFSFLKLGCNGIESHSLLIFIYSQWKWGTSRKLGECVLMLSSLCFMFCISILCFLSQTQNYFKSLMFLILFASHVYDTRSGFSIQQNKLLAKHKLF